jgi:amino acid transporter
MVGDEDTGLFFTPIYAMVLNALLTSCYIFVGEFGTLVTFYGVAGYTFYFLTVLGLIILRVKEPALERPYKTWITTPVIFCCVSLFLLMGVPLYYWRIHGRDQVTKRERSSSVSHGWKFWKRLQ